MFTTNQPEEDDIVLLDINIKDKKPLTVKKPIMVTDDELESTCAELQAELKTLREKQDLKEISDDHPEDLDYVDSGSDALSRGGLSHTVATNISTSSISRSNPRNITRNITRKPQLLKGVLKRNARAVVRVMYDHDVDIEKIADEFKRSTEYILRIIQNNLSVPDDLDEDYANIDEPTRARFPPRAVPRRSGPKIPKRTLTLEDVDRASKHRRTEGPDGPKSAESDRTMVNQIPVGNAFREPPVPSTMTHEAVLKFLQGLEPNMERLYPKFEEAKFDDVMLHTISTWSDEEINEYLGDLVKLGLLGIAQRFIVKKGLIRMRTASN